MHLCPGAVQKMGRNGFVPMILGVWGQRPQAARALRAKPQALVSVALSPQTPRSKEQR